MTHTYQLGGMHCGSCVAKVKNEILKLGDVAEATIQLASQQATIRMLHHIPVTALQRAVEKAGAYTIRESEETTKESTTTETKKNWLITYKPLLILFAFITGIAAFTAFHNGQFIWMYWMHSFMAGFFIAFSFFKLLDLKGFADSYSTYDLLAKKVYSYGFVYPFIELGLGIAFLTNWQGMFTIYATIVVMGFSSIGVIQAVVNKRKIRCACLGAVFNLPMSTVTIVEDLLMVIMSIVMLLDFV